MLDNFPVRGAPPSGGYFTIGTMILAAVSAALLVLLSGCHSTPAASGFVSSGADRDAELRLRNPGAMPPLQPFDEGFVTVAEDTP